MKKIGVLLLTLFCLFSITGCFFDQPIEEQEEFVNTKEMEELPKVVFRKLKEYVDINDIKTEAKNKGNFNIKNIEISEGVYLNNNSYYYVTNGNIFLYVEYVYKDKYLCKMTFSDNENSIGSFSYSLIK